MIDEEAFRGLIEGALNTFDGSRRLGEAREYLSEQLAVGRFNTDRALEVFKIAIDNISWDMIKDLPMRSAMHREYLASGLGKAYASTLTEAFKKETGACDQRPPRRFLRTIFGA